MKKKKQRTKQEQRKNNLRFLAWPNQQNEMTKSTIQPKRRRKETQEIPRKQPYAFQKRHTNNGKRAKEHTCIPKQNSFLAQYTVPQHAMEYLLKSNTITSIHHMRTSTRTMTAIR